jgi:hypothetical protein
MPPIFISVGVTPGLSAANTGPAVKHAIAKANAILASSRIITPPIDRVSNRL